MHTDALMPNEPQETRDIVLHQRDGALQRISELHPAYDALQYPILFPHGTDGYSIYLQTDQGRKISQMQFYSYHLMSGPNNHLLFARRLFQQFLVDTYCKIETERLNFLKREQKTLRADNYQNFRDSILSGDADPRNIGHKVILPSSYTGGPRYTKDNKMPLRTSVIMVVPACS